MKVLVVEDEKDISNFIKMGLESTGLVVDRAFNAEKGFFLAKTNYYDAIVLDVRLINDKNIEESGLDLCKKLRNDRVSTPVLILTVKGEIETKVEAFNNGADDYMTKPFAIEELVARIRALTRRGEAIQGDILKVEDLVLNANTHQVTRGKKEIVLTKKEYVLLEYLMRNKGAVLTRSMILEHVWDMNADPFTNTVEVHIRSLRKKLAQKGKPNLIHTIHGYGYKIGK